MRTLNTFYKIGAGGKSTGGDVGFQTHPCQPSGFSAAGFKHGVAAVSAVVALSAHGAAPRVVDGSCGSTPFRVVQVNNGHPLDNVFTLSAVTASGLRELYRGENGGWFHAACLASKDGKPVLVFQSYCGGSACVEDTYGAVDPVSLKLLLRPSVSNVANRKQLSALLGVAAPNLNGDKRAFCCSE